MTSFLKLFSVSILIFAASCVPKLAERPGPETRTLAGVVSERSSITRIDAKMDVVFEKPDSEIYGNAVLEIARSGDLHLKVYTLGILAADISSKDGIIRSTPRLDGNRSLILVQGLRDSLFWWDLKDHTIRNDGDFLVLQNESRTVWLDTGTMLPRRQTVRFDDGKQLDIAYDNPVRSGSIWYMSRMRIELKRSAVTLTIRAISFPGELQIISYPLDQLKTE